MNVLATVIACVLLFIVSAASGQARPDPPPEDMRAASGYPGWSVDARTGCWVWNASPQAGETVTWSGVCGLDGRAIRRGVLEQRRAAGSDRYEGEYRDGRLNGRGVGTWANGHRYEGEWRDGRRDGRGVYTWANWGRYEGEFRDGKPNGRGVYIGTDGRRYEGDWRDGCSREGDERAAIGQPLSDCP